MTLHGGVGAAAANSSALPGLAPAPTLRVEQLTVALQRCYGAGAGALRSLHLEEAAGLRDDDAVKLAQIMPTTLTSLTLRSSPPSLCLSNVHPPRAYYPHLAHAPVLPPPFPCTSQAYYHHVPVCIFLMPRTSTIPRLPRRRVQGFRVRGLGAGFRV